MLEAHAITNPRRKYYKFFFRGEMSPDELEEGHLFVTRWADKHGWMVHRTKERYFPVSNIFEINAWLK